MDSATAKDEYCKLVDRLSPDWRPTNFLKSDAGRPSVVEATENPGTVRAIGMQDFTPEELFARCSGKWRARKLLA